MDPTLETSPPVSHTSPETDAPTNQNVKRAAFETSLAKVEVAIFFFNLYEKDDRLSCDPLCAKLAIDITPNVQAFFSGDKHKQRSGYLF